MLARVLRPVATLLLVAIAVGLAVGWLYLLRSWHVLAAGPTFRGALPLERLAAGDAQPLARLVVAWVPAGVLAGLGLAAIGVRSRPGRVAIVLVLGAVTIFLTSAASEAVTASEALSKHLRPVAQRASPWLAAGLMATGALIVPLRARRERGRAADATHPSGGASAAA